jgi:hypothetical protein
MAVPIWSTVTLLMEFVVTGAVFYIIWTGVAKMYFNRKLAFGVIVYEAFFNISYMLERSLGRESGSVVAQKSEVAALGIFHGVFSLIMFFALVIFFLVAAKHYAKGENFFVHHHRLMRVFLYAWSVSVLSGALLFTRLYIWA